MEMKLAISRDIDEIMKLELHITRTNLNEAIESSFVYIAVREVKIVGILIYDLFWYEYPFMNLLFIHENDRNLGIGSKLLGYWENSIKGLSFKYALTSTQEDETAKFFYEKQGYICTGYFYPPNQDAKELIYQKKL